MNKNAVSLEAMCIYIPLCLQNTRIGGQSGESCNLEDKISIEEYALLSMYIRDG